VLLSLALLPALVPSLRAPLVREGALSQREGTQKSEAAAFPLRSKGKERAAQEGGLLYWQQGLHTLAYACVRPPVGPFGCKARAPLVLCYCFAGPLPFGIALFAFGVMKKVGVTSLPFGTGPLPSHREVVVYAPKRMRRKHIRRTRPYFVALPYLLRKPCGAPTGQPLLTT
jgi:hypothetical protein